MASAGYFGMGGGMGPVRNYLPLLLISKGFTPAEVAFTLAYSNIHYIVMTFGMSYVADRFQLPKTIVFVGSVGAAMSVWTLSLFAQSKQTIWLGVLLYFPFFTPVNALYDRRVLSMLGPERKSSWGRTRMVLSIMWGVGSLGASYAIEAFGWWIMALIFSVGYSMVVTSMFLLPLPAEDCESDGEQGCDGGNTGRRPPATFSSPAPLRLTDVLRTLTSSRRLLAHALSMACIGMCLGVMWSFLIVFMEDLRAPEWVIGISALGMVSTEIFVFAFSKQLLRRISPDQLVSLALFAKAVRMVGYGVMPDARWTLLLNPLHGISFACAWLAVVQVFSSDFPAEQSNSAFGVLNAAMWGVGPLVANAITGNVYGLFGPRVVFCSWGVVAFLTGVFYTMALDPWGWSKMSAGDAPPRSPPTSIYGREEARSNAVDEELGIGAAPQ
jgi:hypothetical protein